MEISSRIKAIIGVVVLALGATFYMFFIQKPGVVTVVGQGKIDVEPQEASLIVTRLNVSESPVRAIEEGDTGVKVLIDAAQNAVGDDVKIERSFYTITPASVAQGSARQYQVVNAFKITMNNPSVMSPLIKSLYSSGATTVSDVVFTPKDKEKVELQAHEKAVTDAKEQAKQLAQAAGKRLGRVVSITEDQSKAESSVSTGLTSGDGANFSSVTVSKRVSVTYEIR